MKKQIIKYKAFLISAFVWGILAHGIVLFNKISFYDDMLEMFDVGATFTSGRWMLGILSYITAKFFGGCNYSLSTFNGIISLFMIGISGVLLIRLFEIEKKISMIAVSGIMVMFPTITSLFCGYMFTTPYYLFAVVLCVGGAYLICKYKRVTFLLGGSLLIAMALGIYQPYLPLALSIMVLYMIKEVTESDSSDWKEYFKKAGFYIIVCCLSVGMYFAVTKVTLSILNLQLDGYKDINNFNMTDIRGYIGRIKLAYMEFLMPTSIPNFVRYNMYRGFLEILYYAMLFFDLVLCIYWMITEMSSVRKKIQYIILLLILPLAINFIFVMVNRWYIYSLMMYAQIMFFFFTIWLTENVTINGKRKINQYKSYVGIGIVLAACIMYWHYDNICYLKAEMMQAEMDSWLTTLVTQIKSTDGYDTSMPIVFVNASNKLDNNWPVISELEGIDIEPFDWEIVINDNSWVNYMKYRCGYEPDILDSKSYEEKEEIITMPSYPNDGSIQILDNVIVVKF